MNILPCINKESTDWKQLVTQTNEQLAKDTYATKGGMPEIINESELLDFLGLEEITNKEKPGKDKPVFATSIHNVLTDLSLDDIYENYKNLNISTAFKKEYFLKVINSLNVIAINDNFIFGTYDKDSEVFSIKLCSATSTKDLYTQGIDKVKKKVNLIAFSPENVAKNYRMSGFESTTKYFVSSYKGEITNKVVSVNDSEPIDKLLKNKFGVNLMTAESNHLKWLNSYFEAKSVQNFSQPKRTKLEVKGKAENLFGKDKKLIVLETIFNSVLEPEYLLDYYKEYKRKYFNNVGDYKKFDLEFFEVKRRELEGMNIPEKLYRILQIADSVISLNEGSSKLKINNPFKKLGLNSKGDLKLFENSIIEHYGIKKSDLIFGNTMSFDSINNNIGLLKQNFPDINPSYFLKFLDSINLSKNKLILRKSKNGFNTSVNTNEKNELFIYTNEKDLSELNFNINYTDLSYDFGLLNKKDLISIDNYIIDKFNIWSKDNVLNDTNIPEKTQYRNELSGLYNEHQVSVVKFLDNFGVKVNLFEEEGSLYVVDLANKTAKISKPEQLDNVLATFLSKFIMYSPEFSKAFEAVLDTDLTLKDKSKVRSKLVKELVEHSLSKEKSNLVSRLLAKFNTASLKEMTEATESFLNKLLGGEELIRLTEKSNFKKVDFEEALKNNPFHSEVLSYLTNKDENITLTGSLALATQGTVFRPEGEVLHDLDFKTTYSETELSDKIKSEYTGAEKIMDIVNDNYRTVSYIIPPKDHNLRITYARNASVIYDVIDNKGHIVGRSRFTSKGGVINLKKVKQEGVKPLMLDFFVGDVNNYESKLFEYGDGKSIHVSDYKDIYDAKLDYSRLKDIYDYNRFLPNTNNDFEFERDSIIYGNSETSSTATAIEIKNYQKQNGISDFNEAAHQFLSKIQVKEAASDAVVQISNTQENNDSISISPEIYNLLSEVSNKGASDAKKVGAIILDKNGKVISTGYNINVDRKSIDLHAEISAILNSDQDLEGCTLVSSLSPCENCAKKIVEAGIKFVGFKENYISTKGNEILSRNNVFNGPLILSESLPNIIKEYDSNTKLKQLSKKPRIVKEGNNNIGEQLSLFNEINKSSHSIQVDKSGEMSLHMNYLSKSSAIQRQKERTDREEQLTFNSNTLGIYEKFDKNRLDFAHDVHNQVAEFISTATQKDTDKPIFMLNVNSTDNKGNTLQTVQQTKEWGKRVKNHFETLYDSKVFGEMIFLKDKPNGTELSVIINKPLMDHFEGEYNKKTEEEEQLIQDDLIEEQVKNRNKSEESFVKSDTFINKNVTPKVAKFIFSKVGKFIYASENDLVAEFGNKAHNIPVISDVSNIFVNKERVSLDAPIRLFAGHAMLRLFKNNDKEAYNKLINLISQSSTYNSISPRLNFLNKESISIAVFSKLLNENEIGTLNDEESSYLKEFSGILSKYVSLNDIFNNLTKKELNINLNSSLRDIVIKLKDDENFILDVNRNLELSKEDIFSDISNKDLENKLEELNYIQKICKI